MIAYGTVKAYSNSLGARLLCNSASNTCKLSLHSRSIRSGFSLQVNRRHDANGLGKAVASYREFSSGGRSEDNGVSKQQKLEELIEQYQKVHPGPVDRTSLNTALSGASSVETASTPGSKRVFEETMAFPTQFMIKIVGQNEPTFVADMLKVIAKCLDQNKPQTFPHSIKETAGGKYLSLTVKPLFRSSEELYAVYAAIGTDKRVKITL